MKRNGIESTDSELNLVNRAKKGDEKAFTELVKRYESTVYSFAYKVCRNEEKAEETLQDTFVNVYRKLDQFNGKAKFSTWLYQIVTNNCLMKRRKSKLQQTSVPLDPSTDMIENFNGEDAINPIHTIPLNTTPQDEFINKELREHLDKAILNLPMDQRIVFILRDVEGKSSEEAARILKLTVPAVKSRLRRARVSLREEMQDYIKE